MKLLHTKFHYYNISRLSDNIRKTLKRRILDATFSFLTPLNILKLKYIMKLLHTKFHCNNIQSWGDINRKTLKRRYFGRQVFGCGLGVAIVDKKRVRVGQSGSEHVLVQPKIKIHHKSHNLCAGKWSHVVFKSMSFIFRFLISKFRLYLTYL